MNEAEWLESLDSDAMLVELVTPAVCANFGLLHSIERKIRLYAVACCRRIWNLLIHESSRKAVDLAEWMAEQGYQSFIEGEHKAALEAVDSSDDWALARAGSAAAATLLLRAIRGREIQGLTGARFSPESNAPIMPEEVFTYALTVAKRSRIALALPAGPEMEKAALTAEQAQQALLLRCIFGSPFHPLPAINPSWLRWNDGTVVKIAQAIYDERRFEDMFILADALEEAGCDNLDILAHCRRPGPHVRGCWVVDHLLKKD